MLFTAIVDTIQLHSVYITIIGPFVRKRFSSLRQRLLDLTFDTPTQSFDYTILLVIDEAQNLGKHKFGSFPTRQLPPEAEQRAGAASIDKYMRLILTPLVHGFYGISADRNQFCVVPCGNDLSVFHTKWCEDPSFIKGYHTQLAPFTDFQGWESLEQVQHYRDLVCRSLPNSEARNIFNARVPDESIPELFARLRGSFRPIVSVIERMTIPNNGGFDWRQAIKETEDTLSSTESRYYSGGNIIFDISRMIQTAHNFEWRYGKYQNISTILKAFVLEHYLYGRPLLLNKEEAPLVEASVGRILPLGEHTATVLDEPLALRATVNYFRRSDPHFSSAISAFFDSGSKASVDGHQWEIVVLPSLAHVFHDKILSTTDLVPNWEKSWYPMLNGKAEIVGYANHLTLGTDFETMSLDMFLDIHVYHGSCKDGKSVPPFYLPVETASGLDVMTRTEGQSSFSTAESDEAQGRLQETMLQKYCTGCPKRFLGVVIAYPFEFAGVDSTFPEIRRGGRIWFIQGDALQCISLNIDKNNFHDLCLKYNMQALVLLKENKRQLDQIDGGQGGDDQKDEPATKLRRCKDEGEDSRVNS
ncbi:hypothetical protein BGZ91_001317 [Linnemannia elongata]|nr:hypothetical protein BGZ91_001317 [Linnemannia elongata]